MINQNFHPNISTAVTLEDVLMILCATSPSALLATPTTSQKPSWRRYHPFQKKMPLPSVGLTAMYIKEETPDGVISKCNLSAYFYALQVAILEKRTHFFDKWNLRIFTFLALLCGGSHSPFRIPNNSRDVLHSQCKFITTGHKTMFTSVPTEIVLAKSRPSVLSMQMHPPVTRLPNLFGLLVPCIRYMFPLAVVWER